MSKKKSKLTTPNVKMGHVKLVTPKRPRGQHKIHDSHFRDEKPSISLKHIDLNFKSFHDLRNTHKLKEFDRFLKKVGSYDNWNSVFTKFQRDDTNTKKCRDKIRSLGLNPKQIEIFHLRVGEVFRIHGYMRGERFKLIWLDPDHELNRE